MRCQTFDTIIVDIAVVVEPAVAVDALRALQRSVVSLKLRLQAGLSSAGVFVTDMSVQVRVRVHLNVCLCVFAATCA